MADTTTELEVLNQIVDVLGGQSGQYETVVPVLQQIKKLLAAGITDPEAIAEAVAAWLDEHPEATTTVQDGSITGVKIADDTIPDAKLAQTGGVLSEVHDVRTGVGGTLYASAGAAVRGQVSALENSVYEVEGLLFEDGDAVTLQVATASSFTKDVPSGFINVKSTDASIYTGSVNLIDLFGLAQGTFIDAHSGVVIEVNGNEVYLHGSPSAGFRFDFQKGEFYTDSFVNHAADFGNFPSDSSVKYRFCWVATDGSNLPTNIYIASLNAAGTALSADPLIAGAHDVNMLDGQYFVMYSNAAISNLDIRFKMGLKFYNLGTDAGGSISVVANTVPNTRVIEKAGYYECGAFTWTGASTNYEVVKATRLIKPNPLIDGHVYAWFGDSLSQLKELPNLVSGLLDATVYDCSFAGAPLTFGDPTKYQPTGFMSLCSQIAAGDFTELSDALDAQEAAGTNVTEKREHLATLEALDFDTITDVVVFAGTNDFDNDYVNATNFVSGFSGALTTLLTAYPHLIVYVFAPIWRGDKDEGVASIPTMEDLVQLEKDVADDFCLPFYDLYHRSGINSLTASVYLQNDILHPSDAGDELLANKCAKFLTSN